MAEKNPIAIANLKINGVMRGLYSDIYLLALQITTEVGVPAIKNDSKEYMLVVLSVESVEDLSGIDKPFL
ncbi:hypothetical protein SpiBuddy_2371 [Sphaerochaeta globosa str. Buddy]|uniref:Uncharacterized protein n=2 Tax=Sphaerochaeta TaxID=399320 RepID=F0RRD4_SPHGB|nr:hypothetical protein SpiBuddy_2371 [Sphaerochaeta globosa str. Buddy]